MCLCTLLSATITGLEQCCEDLWFSWSTGQLGSTVCLCTPVQPAWCSLLSQCCIMLSDAERQIGNQNIEGEFICQWSGISNLDRLVRTAFSKEQPLQDLIQDEIKFCCCTWDLSSMNSSQLKNYLLLGHNIVLLLLRLAEDFLSFQSAQSLGQEMPPSASSQSCFLKG